MVIVMLHGNGISNVISPNESSNHLKRDGRGHRAELGPKSDPGIFYHGGHDRDQKSPPFCPLFRFSKGGGGSAPLKYGPRCGRRLRLRGHVSCLK